MRKLTKLLAVITVIYFITAAALKSYSDSEEFFQTWDEFIESGVKIEYGEAAPITDLKNDK